MFDIIACMDMTIGLWLAEKQRLSVYVTSALYLFYFLSFSTFLPFYSIYFLYYLLYFLLLVATPLFISKFPSFPLSAYLYVSLFFHPSVRLSVRSGIGNTLNFCTYILPSLLLDVIVLV